MVSAEFRLEARLKASPQRSDDLAKIVSRASAPAAGNRQADAIRTDGSGASGQTKTKNKA